MLADLSKRIFDILGRPLEARGIFTIEQLPGLISTLETAILKDLEDRSQIKTGNQDHAEMPKLADRLGQRAYPFLELLKQSNAKAEPVMWGV